jgi:hypothetical protein
VHRIGAGHCSKSEGNIRIARAFQAATIRSETPANTSSPRPRARTVFSFEISTSSVSNPNGPGSAFNCASNPGVASNA